MKYIGKSVMQQPIVGDITYTHTQAGASETWTVIHRLHRKPSVTIVDLSDNLIFADVEYDSDIQITITFNGATAGKAYLN
tara:strand:- start:654 stop:893 length:240 start_codon:yes stop_codon:yes gene_type:complete